MRTDRFLPRHQASTTAQYLVPVDVLRGKLSGSVTYSCTDKQYGYCWGQAVS